MRPELLQAWHRRRTDHAVVAEAAGEFAETAVDAVRFYGPSKALEEVIGVESFKAAPVEAQQIMVGCVAMSAAAWCERN